ncbi:hypothetical protein N9S67_00310 [Candidatus Pelagibacter sp.]|nr:hypothetical protein [Candidatus Pelagibacter sp.]
MTIDFLLLIITFFLILLSILGYGYQLALVSNIKCEIGYKGLLGIFFLIIYSIVSNFFVPHDKIHNSIIIVIGIILFIINFLKKKYSPKELKLLSITSLIFLITVFLYKNHDDFFYYHLPYELTLLNYTKMIGLGKLGIVGFNTHSSIFYLNSLFYIPVINLYALHFGVIYIYLFSITIILDFILKKISTKKIDYLFFQYLFALIFSLVFFYRIAEHGTDRSGLLLAYILILLTLEAFIISNRTDFLNQFNKMLLVLALTVSFKSFFIIYFSFLILLIWVKRKFLIKIFNYLILNAMFYFFILSIFLVTLTTFLNSGCLVFPLALTCFDFDWSNSIDSVNHTKNWFELWSKAGATPHYKVEDPNIYIKNFNWLSLWIKEYFFNKVSDFLLSIIFISLVFVSLFKVRNYNKIIRTIKPEHIYLYLLIIIIFFEWFLNHPSLRYGGYTIVALLFFYPMSFIFKMDNKYNIFVKKTFIIIIISFSVFLLRNIDRLNKEYQQYGYNLFLNPYFRIDNVGFRLEYEIKDYINKNVLCKKGSIYVYKKSEACN